jgi:hypothetical protein
VTIDSSTVLDPRTTPSTGTRQAAGSADHRVLRHVGLGARPTAFSARVEEGAIAAPARPRASRYLPSSTNAEITAEMSRPAPDQHRNEADEVRRRWPQACSTGPIDQRTCLVR